MSLKSVLVVSAVLAPAVALAVPSDQVVFNDFEGFNPNTTIGAPITLGASPDTATLTGNAFAGVVGIGPLYHSGVRSWMVIENSVGRVDFETNAGVVEFFAKTHPSADGDTVITAFDDLGQVVGTAVTIQAGTSDPADPAGRGFTLVSFSGEIDHVTIANNATNFMNGIDDFGFTPVPEPATAALLATAAIPLFRRRGWSGPGATPHA